MLSGIQLLIMLGLLMLHSVEVHAADPLCTEPGYKLYTNSLGQDPCLVATNLYNACPDSPGTPIQVQDGYHYAGPEVTNECGCNTVLYSMLSVCAYCRAVIIENWNLWNENCTETFSNYPRTLPANTNVQSWAYLPLLDNKTIDVDAIAADYNDGGFEESVGPAISSTLSAASGGSAASPSASEETGQNDEESDNGDSSVRNVGAIAGSIVGGTVAIVLTLFIIV